MLSDKEIEHIANLARIRLSDKEKKQFPKELSSILDYIDQLNEVDTKGVEPLYQTTGLINSFRPDKDRKSFVMDKKLEKLLIEQAPHKEKRFIKVKSVLKK